LPCSNASKNRYTNREISPVAGIGSWPRELPLAKSADTVATIRIASRLPITDRTPPTPCSSSRGWHDCSISANRVVCSRTALIGLARSS
jgi:hypothetical protein